MPVCLSRSNAPKPHSSQKWHRAGGGAPGGGLIADQTKRRKSPLGSREWRAGISRGRRGGRTPTPAGAEGRRRETMGAVLGVRVQVRADPEAQALWDAGSSSTQVQGRWGGATPGPLQGVTTALPLSAWAWAWAWAWAAGRRWCPAGAARLECACTSQGFPITCS